ncbi:MAG TPA: methyltransferase domain-containing protein [Candidatus Brocadiia bacterium]|nr:methyltransferase domain-containing protein [Candidatus Brocadiales bacterium]
MTNTCPCCGKSTNNRVKNINGYDYFQCANCKLIFIDSQLIDKIDNGFNIVKYDYTYWENELPSAKDRSYGAALARMAEVFYYCRIPIKKFLDIGTGAGYFLDAVSKYLPNNANLFYGVEKFPPPSEFQTKSPNYIIGDVSDINSKFDAGMCMEVLEHLTPKMVRSLLEGLAKISNPGALYIFNTGLQEYVLNENINYLDPVKRGHILSYSIKAINLISKEFEFSVLPIRGKTWAFVLEYKSRTSNDENIESRIWSALEHNLSILSDKDMGSVLRILGLETSRAYK